MPEQRTEKKLISASTREGKNQPQLPLAEPLSSTAHHQLSLFDKQVNWDPNQQPPTATGLFYVGVATLSGLCPKLWHQLTRLIE